MYQFLCARVSFQSARFLSYLVKYVVVGIEIRGHHHAIRTGTNRLIGHDVLWTSPIRDTWVVGDRVHRYFCAVYSILYVVRTVCSTQMDAYMCVVVEEISLSSWAA